MNFFFEFLLPPVVDSTISGIKFPVYLFMLIAILSAVRSCIHLLAPDGGAGSIAGLDLSVDGAQGIIFSFALWGSAQLIYSFVQLAVAFRYWSLVRVREGHRFHASHQRAQHRFEEQQCIHERAHMRTTWHRP
jgi:hypothetical protein